MSFLGVVLELCAGLVLFLSGMSTMSKGLETAAGDKSRAVLKKMTDNAYVGVLTGIVVTAAIQSSSATTVMLVGFVASGLMPFKSTVPVLLGANIGTTVTAWLLSLSGIGTTSPLLNLLKPRYFAPVLAIIGTVFAMTSKNEKKKTLGAIFIGFNVLIYGMEIMSDSVGGLAKSPSFAELLLKFDNPVLGVLTGAGVTAVIQSSSASVGILQALSLTGTITYDMAVPVIIGQNIGTCVTGLVSVIGADAKAKRVAVAQLLINVFGMIAVLPLYLLTANYFGISIGEKTVTPVSIATVHSLFNIVTVAIFMPFSGFIAKVSEKLVKENSL